MAEEDKKKPSGPFTWCQNERIGITRVCTTAEKYEISLKNVLVKQAVSFVLLCFVIWYLYMERVIGEREFRWLFDCSDIEKNPNYSDEYGQSLCYFKDSMVVISWILLLPVLLEAFSVLNILLLSSMNNNVLIPIVDDEYCGFEEDIFSPNPNYLSLNGLFSTSVIRRTIVGLASVFYLPYRMEAARQEKDRTFSSKVGFYLFVAFRIVFTMLPDFLLTFSLFFVSWFVLESTETASDLFINLVAVQVFANIDDIFVKMIMRPRDAIGETVKNYVRQTGDYAQPYYEPLSEYKRALDRHEFGVKTEDGIMKGMHDYEGFHFSP